MVITQDMLIRQTADQANIPPAAMHRLFQVVEETIFDYLTCENPAQDLEIRLFGGISLKRNYRKEKRYSRGCFQDIDCPAHVTVKPHLTKYYNRQVNRRLFPKQGEGL